MSEVKLNARKKIKINDESEVNVRLLPNHEEEKDSHPNLSGDVLNIILLLFLYLLQGIPLGLTSAIPMLLQNRGANYKQQAEFSFSYFPFSLKLLWAPIVDSLFWAKFGRRKSWLVPTQYLIGLFMVILSYHVDHWLGGGSETEHIPPDVQSLTLIFFALNFLVATQDIAVDGWALTMLKRCNVSYASTCNSVGQTAGYFLGYVVFIALESKVFCNTYLRNIPEETGLVTLPQFLWFWGVCFALVTTLIAFLKKENKENHHSNEDPHEFNIVESYQNLMKILKLRPIQILIMILLTVKVTFSASDAVSSLKLIDAGVPKEKLALLAIPIIPLQIILPVIVSKYTNGPKPLKYYIRAIVPRIVFAITAVLIVSMTPYLIKNGGEDIPIYYYVILLVNYAIYQIFLYMMFVSIMAFFARISDPAIGGTYMTLLNTVCNLGGNWPNTVALWLVDALTIKKCLYENENSSNKTFYCNSEENKNQCVSSGGDCTVTIDGYYVESLICVIYGVFWIFIAKKWVNYLQELPIKEWLVVESKKQYKSR